MAKFVGKKTFNDQELKIQYDGTNWLEFSDFIIKKVETKADWAVCAPLLRNRKLPEVTDEASELDNLHNTLQSMLAMSHIKAAAENPDWVNHAKSQMLELGGTIEPFPFGSKQPIKIERPIDEQSVDDDEEADEEEYAEDESASELKPAATGRKIK